MHRSAAYSDLAAGSGRWGTIVVVLLALSTLTGCDLNLKPTGAIKATVSGLKGSGLELWMNGHDPVAVEKDGEVTLAYMVSGYYYSVSVKTQPTSPAQTCTVENATGVMGSADVMNVTVSCFNTYGIGGTVSGLEGTGLILNNRLGDDTAGEDLAISGNGMFIFPTRAAAGTSYETTVSRQPDPNSPVTQVCSGHAKGTIGESDVFSIEITCSTLTPNVDPVCTAGASTCKDSNTLSVCLSDGSNFDNINCPYGCSSTGTAHCKKVAPTAPVVSTDFTVSRTLSAITIPAGEVRLNTDTGEISGTITRTPNHVFTELEVNANIGFRKQNGVGVFIFGSLSIPNNSMVKLFGTNAAAFVSANDIIVYGVIDARPMDSSGTICPAGVAVAGPGGSPGGVPGQTLPSGATSGSPGAGPGGGAGGGHNSYQGNPGGGGGGGHGASGGRGSSECRPAPCGVPSTQGGSSYDTEALFGGSGGGGGGTLGVGGGGGGAVRIVSNSVVTIGDGVNTGGINAGACGGTGKAGGGSGGSIFIEAAVVQLNARGALAVNGGGGGGALSPSDVTQLIAGENGKLDAIPAYGGGSYGDGTKMAGNGGAGDAPAGVDVASGHEGLGGGGAAGRIRILMNSGASSLNSTGIISPSIASGAATIGAVTIQ